MFNPILSICIPTFNRCDMLENTLKSIVDTNVFQSTNEVEIVISNNCSEDETNELCLKYAEKYPQKIKYINQEQPIFSDNHIFKTMEYASGIFCKLSNDTCVYRNGALDKIVYFLKEHKEEDCIFFLNKKTKKNQYKRVTTLDDFIKIVSFKCTWIGSLCIKKDVYNTLKEPLRCSKLNLAQVDIYGQLFENNYSATVFRDILFDVQSEKVKTIGYNIAEVFGKNYFTVLKSFVGKNNGISNCTINGEKWNIINFINSFYFDVFNKYNIDKSNYFKILKDNFMLEPCFYLNGIKYSIKKFLHI